MSGRWGSARARQARQADGGHGGVGVTALYLGYFESPFGEQWIFTFDRTTGPVVSAPDGGTGAGGSGDTGGAAGPHDNGLHNGNNPNGFTIDHHDNGQGKSNSQ